jgi:DNA-binding response OmpR family regulator
MQGKRTPSCYEPVLLLDPEMDRATSLATQLESIGFPTRTESTGAAALAAIKGGYFATYDLRRASARIWVIVVTPRCDTKTCKLIYRHGGDACMTAPASIDDLTGRLAAFQLRGRPLY